jgi:uncharacterized protein YwgA
VVQELGETGDITNFESRKRFQKTVYLGQLGGVDLGYRYGWYVKGPYSTALTRDYYALSEVVSQGEVDYQGQSLNQHTIDRLSAVKGLFKVPNNVPLDKADWLELLASWHYLRKVNRRGHADALEIMRRQKPQLSEYVPQASAALEELGLAG